MMTMYLVSLGMHMKSMEAAKIFKDVVVDCNQSHDQSPNDYETPKSEIEVGLPESDICGLYTQNEETE